MAANDETSRMDWDRLIEMASPTEPPGEVDPDALVIYNGVQMAIKDVPNPSDQAYLGYGHQPIDSQQRTIHEGDWPYTPETCRRASISTGWTWIKDGTALACPGCGIDGT